MDHSHATRRARRAVVAGGSISGLLAARVLSRFFDEVCVIERDETPVLGAQRRGVPQARHPHVLLAQGRIWLEQLLPGLGADLVAQGALRVRWPEDVRWHASEGRSAPRVQTDVYSYSSSRMLLEQLIRKHVARIPNIRFLFSTSAEGLELDATGATATGLRIRHVGESSDEQALTSLPADLIVDAMGRASRSSDWLASLGKTKPSVTVVHPYAGYASCTVSLPQHRWPDSALLLVREPSGEGRAGGLYRIEGDLFIATVVGVERDYPPTDFAGLVAFARTLPSTALYDVLQHASPLSEVASFRRTENRLVHYERNATVDGLIVLGDAACAFNPVYSQGMAVAAQAAVTLERCLSSYRRGPHGKGFAAFFQRTLARENKVSWQLSSSADVEHAKATAARAHVSWSLSLRHRLLRRVLERALERPRLTRAFVEVMNLVRSPWYLLHPRLVFEWARRGKAQCEVTRRTYHRNATPTGCLPSKVRAP